MKIIRIFLPCLVIIFSPLANAMVIPLEAGGTFLLRHSSDITGNTTAAVSIDLVSQGFSAGDSIFLESLGDFDKGPGGDTITDWTLGVFSSSNTLLAATASHRVPDAIDAGVDHVSGNTWNWNTNSTTSDSMDIAEDFRIFGEGSGGTTITIPLGAQFLFVGNLDNGNRDNVDPDNDYALRISAVPVPAAVWLFGSALGLLGWMRRKTT